MTMTIRWSGPILACVAAILAPLPLHAAITLVPVATGLTNPLFLVHAGDGSRRLFIVEQPGTIQVLQPGAALPAVFLDVRDRVLSGGERGLLGLAFHPRYAANGRFYIYYTRKPDGAIVVSMFQASANRDVAATAETPLLTIPHPVNANHNGGMLAFGPGGYLFIGVGDGGSANDPPNNAQNIESLLGKILRVNVDNADTTLGTPYSVPAGNPFVGKAGRDEIFAYGLRNPWRFSFDRRTEQQWVGDVGQDRFEEVDSPILSGGNYGWRVYEGATCTNTDASLCGPGRFIAPVFDYAHGNGRCSITGGYVYRGSRAAVPDGTYVYGDYCSGEIFAWDGRAQQVLARAGGPIASFGEDEAGELYVVLLTGTVARIADLCEAVVMPEEQRFGIAGGIGTLTVDIRPECTWTAASDSPWIGILPPPNDGPATTVTYLVTPFVGFGRSRTGSISVGRATLSITQTR